MRVGRYAAVEKIESKLFKLLVSSVNECAIFMTDTDGYVRTWNAGAAALSGYIEKEIIGQHVSIFYVPGNEPQTAFEAALKKGEYKAESWHVKKDGSKFWACTTFTSVFDDGELLGFAILVHDLSRRAESKKLDIEIENTLKAPSKHATRPQQWFYKLIENSNDGVVLMDSGFNVFYRSKSAERINGWSEKDRRPGDFVSLVHPDDVTSLQEIVGKIAENPGASLLARFRLRHKHGHYIWLESRYTNMLHDTDIQAIVCNFRDITERNNVEILLKERTKQIDVFLSRTTDGFISLDKNFCYTCVNKKFCEAVGLSPDALIGKNVWEMFPHAIGSATYHAFHRAFNEQKIIQNEDHYAPLDIWYEDAIYPSEEGLTVFIQDITERKRAEKQISEKQEELAEALEMQVAVLNALPPLIALLNENGKIIAVNDAWKQFTLENNLGIPHFGAGYSYLTICEKAVGLDKSDKGKIGAGIESVLSGRMKTFELEHQGNLRGKPRWFKFLVSPLQDKKKKNVMVMHIDLTDRKSAEASLIKSEANLRSIFENTDLSIVLLDTDLRIISFNANAQDFAKKHFDKKLKIGNIGPDFLPKERRPVINEAVRRAKNNETVAYEAFYNMPDGSTEWFEVKWIGVADNDGQNVNIVLTFKNISRKKHYEKERNRMTAELVQRNKDLGEYAYTLSHSLRALLANIIGLSNILNTADSGNKSIKESIDALSVSANDLDKAVDEMNLMSQTSRRANDKYEWLSLSSIIKDIQDHFNDIISENKLVIESNLKVDNLWGYRAFVYNILFNLILNSIRYKQPGRDPLITIESFLKKNSVELTFTDNGKEIDLEKYRWHTFRIYRKFDKQTGENDAELFMVKSQVEELGGHINVRSSPGKGVTFVIDLPVLQAE
ncbi:MAG TPA: PAS domain-containing sensor histidine kinase [Mucilaginibacter sp.]|nr:PAS domain-containing sensor histidine kinase [Mucilaginibacter sp.]